RMRADLQPYLSESSGRLEVCPTENPRSLGSLRDREEVNIVAPLDFHFGLEGEYLLVDAESYRPLWHPDLKFAHLNAILEGIPYEPLLEGLTLDGLELDPPHRRLMPYYVEGYGLPDPSMSHWVDLLPKAIEIRTPVCPSLDVCLRVYENLHQTLQ